MRVALFLPNLVGGGAERVFALLAEGLAARGIDTEVVLAHAEGPHLAAVQAVVPVVDLHVGRTRHSLLPLARYLRRRRPDVLVTALEEDVLVGGVNDAGSPALSDPGPDSGADLQLVEFVHPAGQPEPAYGGAGASFCGSFFAIGSERARQTRHFCP